LAVDVEGRHLVRAGRPVFLLADTLWAAFSRMTDVEWSDALRLRRRQGFNAVNVSVLPIAHDRSLGGDASAPFSVRADGSWDLDQVDGDYFAHARQMVQEAQDLGFTAVLVALWCNYVPNTWGSAKTPELVLSEDQTDRYLDLLVETFADLDPILCVSGDDSLDDPVALNRYHTALHRLKQRAPGCLTTTHSNPNAVLPRNWAEDPSLNVYAYQAGHDDGWEERSVSMAERHATLVPRKPVFSMEPCYEGHGYGAGRGRHDARSVRRALTELGPGTELEMTSTASTSRASRCRPLGRWSCPGPGTSACCAASSRLTSSTTSAAGRTSWSTTTAGPCSASARTGEGPRPFSPRPFGCAWTSTSAAGRWRPGT